MRCKKQEIEGFRRDERLKQLAVFVQQNVGNNAPRKSNCVSVGLLSAREGTKLRDGLLASHENEIIDGELQPKLPRIKTKAISQDEQIPRLFVDLERVCC